MHYTTAIPVTQGLLIAPSIERGLRIQYNRPNFEGRSFIWKRNRQELYEYNQFTSWLSDNHVMLIISCMIATLSVIAALVILYLKGSKNAKINSGEHSSSSAESSAQGENVVVFQENPLYKDGN